MRRQRELTGYGRSPAKQSRSVAERVPRLSTRSQVDVEMRVRHRPVLSLVQNELLVAEATVLGAGVGVVAHLLVRGRTATARIVADLIERAVAVASRGGITPTLIVKLAAAVPTVFG